MAIKTDSVFVRAWAFTWRGAILGCIGWGTGKVLDALSKPDFGAALGSMTAPFFAASSAPLWFTGAGVFAGFVWAAWPSISPRMPQIRPKRVFTPQPLVKGAVLGFQMVDSFDLTKDEFADLSRELVSPPYPRFWYVARLEIETTGAPSRATDWRFLIKKTTGFSIPCEPAYKRWSRPAAWPALPYVTVRDIASMYLDRNTVYNILVFLQISAPQRDLKMSSLVAWFKDSNGMDIALVGPATLPTQPAKTSP